MDAFYDLDRYTISKHFEKSPRGEYILADDARQMCIDYEAKIKSLEIQIGDLEDKIFELTRTAPEV